MKDENMRFDPLEALTVPQAARLLNVSRPTVEKYIKAGDLPSVLIGHCRRIRRIDVEAFLERRTAYGWRRHEPEPARPVDGPTEWAGEGDDIPF